MATNLLAIGTAGATNATSALSAWLPAGSMRQRVVLALAFALLVAIVALAARALMLSKSSVNGGPPTPASVTLWPPPAPAGNLVPVAGTLPPAFVPAAPYALLLDVLWADARRAPVGVGAVPTATFRHLLHRGGDATTFDANGLPPSMNPGVFADPNTNDLLVFVDTASGATGAMTRDSVRVRDLPLGAPGFRLGLVVNATTLEVYVGGRLVRTSVLSGAPVLPAAAAVVAADASGDAIGGWHALTGATPVAAAVQNLVLYNGALPPAAFAAAGATPSPPFPESATAAISPTTCASSAAAAAPAPAAAAATTTTT